MGVGGWRGKGCGCFLSPELLQFHRKQIEIAELLKQQVPDCPDPKGLPDGWVMVCAKRQCCAFLRALALILTRITRPPPPHTRPSSFRYLCSKIRKGSCTAACQREAPIESSETEKESYTNTVLWCERRRSKLSFSRGQHSFPRLLPWCSLLTPLECRPLTQEGREKTPEHVGPPPPLLESAQCLSSVVSPPPPPLAVATQEGEVLHVALLCPTRLTAHPDPG